MSTLSFRAITAAELPEYRRCMVEVFGGDPADDPHGLERLQAIIDPARTFCAFDGDQLVATAGTYPFDYAVPGGTVKMAGLTQVTVRPTHRRRGILRNLIAAHLGDAEGHGAPVSGLWASDASIYGRFGYGVAAEAEELTITPDAGFDRVPAGGFDQVVAVEESGAHGEFSQVYDAAMATRPGMFSRHPGWWKWRRFTDRADQKRGRSPRRHLVCRRGDRPTGYVTYRQHLDFDPNGRPSGALDIEELVATDATAEATLWQHVTRVDLYPRITYWNAPTDALAPWLAADRRNVMAVRRSDTVWLRIGDVAAALAARRYANDGVVRFTVMPPTGAGDASVSSWELVVEGGSGHCVARPGASRVAPGAELELDLAALGSIYLGGYPPSLLARTGMVRGSAEAIARADRIFTWTAAAPWCAEIF
jgi:predicted acetyltransferase